MVIDARAADADHLFVLVLHAIAIATTMGLIWFCAAVIGDIAVRERALAESVAQHSERVADVPTFG